VKEREKKRRREILTEMEKKKRMKEQERKIKNEKYWKKRRKGKEKVLRDDERKKVETDRRRGSRGRVRERQKD
jgi:hypothetical protein